MYRWILWCGLLGPGAENSDYFIQCGGPGPHGFFDTQVENDQKREAGGRQLSGGCRNLGRAWMWACACTGAPRPNLQQDPLGRLLCVTQRGTEPRDFSWDSNFTDTLLVLDRQLPGRWVKNMGGMWECLWILSFSFWFTFLLSTASAKSLLSEHLTLLHFLAGESQVVLLENTSLPLPYLGSPLLKISCWDSIPSPSPTVTAVPGRVHRPWFWPLVTCLGHPFDPPGPLTQRREGGLVGSMFACS